MWAAAIMPRADKNKDGKITLDELLAAADVLFQECDKDKDRSLSEEEIGIGFSLLLPQFGGFGPQAKPAGKEKTTGEKGLPRAKKSDVKTPAETKSGATPAEKVGEAKTPPAEKKGEAKP